MRERLRTKSGITPIIAIVAVLGMVALVSVPWGVAGEGKSLAQQVRDAKTPAQQKAKQHSQLKDAYAVKPDMHMMVAHCDALVKHYQEIAKDLEDMAKMHKQMATMAR
jgi:hypothetical protein